MPLLSLRSKENTSDKIYLTHQERSKTMNIKTIGLVILIIGLLITTYTGFNFETREKLISKGNVMVTKDKEHTVNWPPFIGIGVIVFCGSVLLSG